MFIPTNFPSTAYDPIEQDRVESGRPASRVEVIQRHQRASRHETIASVMDAPQASDRQDSPRFQMVPDAIDGIRRSLSRALVNVGQRIGPEAA